MTDRAVCQVRGDGIIGTVLFAQELGPKVTINVFVTGLSPGQHGIHVHEYGDMRQGCKSAGGHFNPYDTPHGGRTGTRHVGDFGNVTADTTGIVDETFQAECRLGGPAGIVGRGLVIHQQRDDLGLGPSPESLVNGNSGPRACCGIIGWAAP